MTAGAGEPRRSKVKSKLQPIGPPGLHEDGNGFDITVESVIGQVRFGPGEETSGVAAFKAIAEYDGPGTFKFPNAAGKTTIVKVSYE